MRMSGISVRRGVTGILVTSVLAGAAAAVAAPAASAAPCLASAATGTISAVAGNASQYLATHPGADQVLSDAATQPREDARVAVRAYFTANPGEYFDLKGITAPLVDLQNQCAVNGVPTDLLEAFDEFQAG